MSYKGSLETEVSALLEKRKELYSKSRSAKDEDTKSQVKAELSDISKRLSICERRLNFARVSPPVATPLKKNSQRYGQMNKNSKERS